MKPAKLEQFFLRLYDKQADAIFRHCYFRVFEREKALELTQETFTKMWDYLSSGKEVQHPKAFLYKTANHLIIDYHRKKKDLSLETMQEEGFQPSMEMDTGQIISAHLVASVLKELNEEERQLIIMRYLEGLKPKEIARVMEESANVISVRLHRAKDKMQKIAQQHL